MIARAFPRIALAWLAAALAAAGPEPLELRILPAPEIASAPLRISLPLGFLEGPSNPFSAERILPGEPSPQAGVEMRRLPGSESEFSNGAKKPRGLEWITRPLRGGIGYSVRVGGECLGGSRRLFFSAEPLAAGSGGRVECAASLVLEKRRRTAAEFQFVPMRSAPYRISLAAASGAMLRLAQPSCAPADAAGPWDGEALAAYRSLAPEELCWPIADGLESYSFYDGVGPAEMRRRANPLGSAALGHPFGTVEAADFCRALGAPLCIRVRIGAETAEADIARAADWVAFCNETGDGALAELRRRCGRAAPLDIAQWEICAPSPEIAERARAAMMRQDDSIEVRSAAPLLAPPGGFADGGGWRAAIQLALACIAAPPRRDANERLMAPLPPERLLLREDPRGRGLAALGMALALVNRDPGAALLEARIGAPVAARAAWNAKDELVILLCNPAPEARSVEVDLSALRGPFAVWYSEQLAAPAGAGGDEGAGPPRQSASAGAAFTRRFRLELEGGSIVRAAVRRK